MKDKSIELSEWEEPNRHNFLNSQRLASRGTSSVDDIAKRVRDRRKEEIGSGRSLVELITENGEPNYEAISNLENILTTISLKFVRRDAPMPERKNYIQFEDFFHNFYRFSLYMYSSDNVSEESIDDLIQLAKVYRRNPETFRVVVENDLPPEMVDELQDWIGYFGDYPICPQGLEDIVLATVAAFLGAIPEPM